MVDEGYKVWSAFTLENLSNIAIRNRIFKVNTMVLM
jgi:hypothetical protein